MIIGCPHCSTKFSIETDRLEGLKNPQFHCSRCDHLFALGDVEEPLLSPQAEEQPQTSEANSHLSAAPEPEVEDESAEFDPFAGFDDDSPADESSTTDEQPLRSEPALEAETPEEIIEEQLTTSINECPENDELLEDTQVNDPEADGTQLDLLSFQSETPSGRHRISNLLEESETPLVTASWPGDNNTNVLEADMRSVLDQHTPAIKTCESPIEKKSNPFERAQFEAKNDEPEPIIKELIKEPSVAPVIDFPKNESEPIETIDDLEFELGIEKEEETPEDTVNPVIAKQRSSANLWLSAPIAFALLFGGLSLQLKSNDALSNSLLKYTAMSSTIAAPEGVSLVDLQPSFIALDNGAQILQLEGVVKNNTPQEFNNLRIEATLHDRENRPIQRLLVAHNNGLNSVSRIESLKEDIVESLQAKQIREEQTLKAKSQPKFKLAFTKQTEQAGWVSARIYSAETGAI